MIDVRPHRENLKADEELEPSIEPFNLALSRHGLKLKREQTHTLQVNVGFSCNQKCLHCHLNAGPDRKESMQAQTVEDVVAYAQRSGFKIIDITGGAPELNPYIYKIIEEFSCLSPRIMFRSNLSALNNPDRETLINLLKSYRVVIIASFPALNENQTNSQRGEKIFQISLDALKRLNALGYGHEDSGLELNLVSNPTGAFLPPSQTQTEKRFRQVLKNKHGIVFNHLFNFANVPLGRFRQWLITSDNYDRYLQKLASVFNPCAVEGVMCRNLVSVAWDGYLFDCDFNLACNLYLGRRKIHVSEMPGPPIAGSAIATADHCYTCTAGTGFT